MLDFLSVYVKWSQLCASMCLVSQCTWPNACLTAWADGANQPVVMLAFRPGATVLIRLSASEVARCALQDRMHQQQATSVQIAWKQIQQYACARTHILVWYN